MPKMVKLDITALQEATIVRPDTRRQKENQ